MARMGCDIDEAENGFIVRASSSEPDGPYHEKRFIAKSQREATKLANDVLSGKIKMHKTDKSRPSNAPVAQKASRRKAAPRKRG